MKTKLIALDVDGTLVKSRGRFENITEDNLKAIEEAKRRGIEVTLITGRGYKGIDDMVKGLGITAPITMYNGGFVSSPQRDHVFADHRLQREDTEKILRLLEDVGMSYAVYANDTIYYRNIGVDVHGHMTFINPKRIEIFDITEVLTYQVIRIIAMDTIERMEEAKARIQEVMNPTPYFVYYQDKEPNLEILHPKAMKNIALHTVAEAMGISTNEIAVIGDHNNDVEMIREAGLGIAMGNGTKEVKEAAAFVTGTVEESGVALAIHKILKDGL